MENNLDSKYDVVIIGAGIGGLVCGCYLVKAGLKILIVEKKASVGGCCRSFISKGFLFDAFAHSLGGLRKDGTLECVLRELGVKNRIAIHRHDPSDVFITPNYRISFWNDLERTIDDLKSKFPGESSGIDNLMNYLAYSKGENTVRLRNLTFSEFMDEFIKDKHLKAILSMPVLGNTGLPPSMISAFTATKLYQEFHLDGGYYPEGGMQSFSDVFAERFKELGGAILLSKSVKRILFTTDGRINGVQLKGGEKIASDIVVSNCDPYQTFNDFMNNVNIKTLNINKMKPSSSLFSIFLGTDRNINNQCGDLKATVWHMLSYDVEDMYLKANEGSFDQILWFMIFSSPDKKGFVISILAPFKDEKFWTNYKSKLFEKLLACAKERLPILESIDIKHKAIITPQTINKWTSNFQGAAYGWASTPSQCVVPGFTQNTCIDGLYLTGHWTTQTLGISGVAYMGRDTAKLISRKHSK